MCTVVNFISVLTESSCNFFFNLSISYVKCFNCVFDVCMFRSIYIRVEINFVDFEEFCDLMTFMRNK